MTGTQDPSATRTLTEGAHRAGARLYLLVLQGNTSSVHHLPRNGIVQIGRSEDADLLVEDTAASRRHAKLILSDGRARIVDLDSHNGTRVNGEPLEGARPLASGDVVSIGSCTLVLHGDAPSAKTRQIADPARFLERLEEELERASEFQRPLSVASVVLPPALLDRDRLAAMLERSLRLVDVAGWSEDGQLQLIVPELSPEATVAATAVLLEALAEQFPAAKAGVAHCPDDGCDAAALIAASRAGASAALPGAVEEATRTVTNLDLGDRSIVIADPAMVRIYELIRRLAGSDLPVLISGETGAGKEHAALAVHRWSARAGRPFVPLNCAAISEGLIESELFGHEKGAFSGALLAKPGLLESAEGGTVFLDEIGELSPAVQAKLLRALETKRVMRVGAVRDRDVDFRIVAATHRNLAEEAVAGRFRQDLFFRLSGAVVTIPPLRDRPREVAVLSQAFLTAACARANRSPMRISAAAMQRLAKHSWPGNVRELKNVMEYAAATATATQDELEPWHFAARLGEPAGPPASEVAAIEQPPTEQPPTELPAEAEPAPREFRPLLEEVRELERQRMIEALDAVRGNQTRAAALIGVPLRTFVTKLKQYGLKSSRR